MNIKQLLRKEARYQLSKIPNRNFGLPIYSVKKILSQRENKTLTILTYTSLPHEPNLSELYTRLEQQYKVTFIIATKELQDPGTLIDLAFVPGLLFEESGVRLGQGGGRYDRFFANHPETYKVGVCYEEQLVDNGKIPVDDWDILMDEVIVL